MCGLAGFFSVDSSFPVGARTILANMGDSIAHRGPDDVGIFVGKNCGFSFRRLSIIDLETGHQPMHSEGGRFVIVFNGEIYNYIELREKLLKKGMQFRTHSDTEVILQGYSFWGSDILNHLRGIFAFVIYDAEQNELFLARDHTGVKPLYYFKRGGLIVFASEIKSILQYPGISANLNRDALPKYLSFLWVPYPETLFEGIKVLEPAHYMRIQRDGIEKKCYWTPNLSLRENGSSVLRVHEWQDILDHEFQRIVKEQMISDVPLGAFLSGGVDSSTVIAYMNEILSEPITTYTTGFHHCDLKDDVIGSDVEYARIAARHLNVEYNELLLEPDVVALLPKIVWHMDEPVADPAAITTYLICKACKNKATVMLSGVGGDEIFAGYPRYLAAQLALKYQRMPGWLKNKVIEPCIEIFPAGSNAAVRNAKKFIKSANLPFKQMYFGYLTYYSQKELETLLAFDFDWDGIFHLHNEVFAAYTSPELLQTMMNLDLKTFLPQLNLMYTDKMSSAASVEVRVPFLDHILIEKVAQIPAHLKIKSRTRKYILKKAVEKKLPPEIVWRKKAGFGAPVGAWLKGQAKELMRDLLSEETVRKRGLFNHAAVNNMIDNHLSGREYNANQIWQLMTLELWLQTFID